MATKYYALLTNVGAAKLANATALGVQLEITQMAVGDGNGALPTPDPAQTSLVHELRRASINTLTTDPVNTNQIIVEQVIPEDAGGWWIREIGLYDRDGDMIAVANCAETYKPQLQEGSGRVQVVRIILIVSSTTAVTLKIDPSVVLATRKYVDDKVIQVEGYIDNQLNEHVSAEDPHRQYLQKDQNGGDIPNKELFCGNIGLGSAALKDVGTESGQIPDMSAFSSGTGWAKQPNGLLIQWGINVAGPAGYPSTISLPVPFPSGFQVVACYDNAATGIVNIPVMCVSPAGNSGIFLMCSQPPGGTDVFCRWVAVGQ